MKNNYQENPEDNSEKKEDQSDFKPCKKRPNQNVRDTSKEAFSKYLASKKSSSETKQVYEYIRDNGASTRLMIAEGSGLPINHVTQAVSTLIKGWLAIKEIYKKPCKSSGNKANYLELTKRCPVEEL